MDSGGRLTVAVYAAPDDGKAAADLCDLLAAHEIDARVFPDRAEPSDVDVAVVLWTAAMVEWAPDMVRRLDPLVANHRIVVATIGFNAVESIPPEWNRETIVDLAPWGSDETVAELVGRIRFAVDVGERFSRTVRSMRDELGPGLVRSASEIITGLQERHSEYAGGKLRDLPVEANRTPAFVLDEWLIQVAAFWPNVDLIDGRLLLVTLTRLDPDAQAILAPVLEDLVAELPPDVRSSYQMTAPQQQQQQQAPEPPAPEPPGREEVKWVPDDPATVDRMQRKPVANFLATQLTQLQDDHPGRTFLVLLDGPWGAGKSTLMRFVQELVPSHWLVIHFDAWRQSKAGPPWLLMLQALRAGLRKAPDRPRLLGVRERLRLVGGFALVGWLVATATVLVAAFALQNVAEVFALALAAVGVAGLIRTGITALGRMVALDSRRGSHAFEMHQTDPMEALAAHFAWLVRQVDRPVLFLVDDVDRCGETYVVDLLDAVQKLVREEPAATKGTRDDSVFFVVAADGRWIRHSYELAHSGFVDAVGEAGRPLGALFLDKLFQLTVPVPIMGPDLQRSFLSHLLDDGQGSQAGAGAPEPDTALVAEIEQAVGDEVVDALRRAEPAERAKVADVAIQRLLQPESQQHTEHRLLKFSPLLEANPRSMKRFVMAYNTLRAVSLAEGNAVPLEPLALWTILTLRWPLLAEYLEIEPGAVAYFRRPPDALPSWVPDTVRTLFSDPPPALRDVMNDTMGPLDAGTIRRCCGLDLEPQAPA